MSRPRNSKRRTYLACGSPSAIVWVASDVYARCNGMVLTDIEGGWAISHEHSGRRVAQWSAAKTLSELAEIMEALATVTDWARPAKRLADLTDMRDVVVGIIEATGGWRERT